MNIRRGLFRLWVVASLLWAIAIAVVAWLVIDRAPYLSRRTYLYVSKETVLPFRPTDGIVWGADGIGEFVDPYDRRTSDLHGFLQVQMPNNTYLYVPDAVATALLKERGVALSAREQDIFNAHAQQFGIFVLLAVLPSVAVLIIGAALGWAFSGFARTPSRQSG